MGEPTRRGIAYQCGGIWTHHLTNTSGTNGLTYRDAGVDIDEGERLVDLIKPAAISTARPGAEAALGGFAAIFDPKAAGFKDPIFLATTTIAYYLARCETFSHSLTQQQQQHDSCMHWHMHNVSG